MKRASIFLGYKLYDWCEDGWFSEDGELSDEDVKKLKLNEHIPQGIGDCDLYIGFFFTANELKALAQNIAIARYLEETLTAPNIKS